MKHSNAIKTLALVLTLALACQYAGAVRARLTPHIFRQSDGSELTVTLNGDERRHYYTTDDNLVVEQRDNGDFCYAASSVLAHNKADRKTDERDFVARNEAGLGPLAAVAARMAGRRAASVGKKQARRRTSLGEQKVLVLLVSFKGTSFSMSDPKSAYEAQLNTDTWSAKNYFEEQSSGKYKPTFVAVGPVELDNKYSYYGQNDRYGDDKYPGEMVAEACRKVDGVVNFADYDYDHDGYVDQVFVIYAWKGEATSGINNTIWPHQWTLTDANGEPLTLDGVKIDSYACTNEIEPDGTMCGVGTFCHEFSHCLGLPDFYADTFGMNVWSVMDYGNYNNDGNTPCNYTAYERAFMGWLDIDEPVQDTTYEMAALSAGGKAYKVQSPYKTNEYYLLENKQKTGWDAYLPSHGMMVLHVDYDPDVWENNEVNTVSSRQNMTIIPADNKLTTSTLQGDLYPGYVNNTRLTDSSTPAAKLNDGNRMGKPITGIGEDDGVVTFTYCRNKVTPVQNQQSETSDSSFVASWHAVKNALSYTVNVTNDSGFDKLIEHVTDTCVVVDGLERGLTYKWKVKTVYSDGEESDYSGNLEVTLAGAGVSGVAADDVLTLAGGVLTVKAGVSARVLDMMGRVVATVPGGGTVPLCRGLYVVQCADKAVKVAVR